MSMISSHVGLNVEIRSIFSCSHLGLVHLDALLPLLFSSGTLLSLLLFSRSLVLHELVSFSALALRLDVGSERLDLANLTINFVYLVLQLEHGVVRTSLLLDRDRVVEEVVAGAHGLLVNVVLDDLIREVLLVVNFDAVVVVPLDVETLLEVVNLANDNSLLIIDIRLKRNHRLVNFLVVEC